MLRYVHPKKYCKGYEREIVINELYQERYCRKVRHQMQVNELAPEPS